MFLVIKNQVLFTMEDLCLIAYQNLTNTMPLQKGMYMYNINAQKMIKLLL